MKRNLLYYTTCICILSFFLIFLSFPVGINVTYTCWPGIVQQFSIIHVCRPVLKGEILYTPVLYVRPEKINPCQSNTLGVKCVSLFKCLFNKAEQRRELYIVFYFFYNPLRIKKMFELLLLPFGHLVTIQKGRRSRGLHYNGTKL